MTENGLTLRQRVAICFGAGVIGGVAVVLFSYVLFELGISATFGVKAPIPLRSPDIYRPLFWGGLWGIPFGFVIKAAWNRLYLFGLFYFIAPVLALFLIFLPGAGKCALRDNHGFGCKGDNGEETLTFPAEGEKPLGIRS
ncbi:MAG: hypothetical protein P8175_19885 [Deltaproteobacteria bacterium]